MKTLNLMTVNNANTKVFRRPSDDEMNMCTSIRQIRV